MSDVVKACADALMKAWFPNNHKVHEWLESEDGAQWREIALLDAKVVIDAYKEFYNEKYES